MSVAGYDPGAPKGDAAVIAMRITGDGCERVELATDVRWTPGGCDVTLSDGSTLHVITLYGYYRVQHDGEQDARMYTAIDLYPGDPEG